MKLLLDITAYGFIAISSLLAAKLPDHGREISVSLPFFLVSISVAIILLLLSRFLLGNRPKKKGVGGPKSLDLAFETTAFLSRLIVFKAQIQDIDKTGLCDLVDEIYTCFVDDLIERKDDIMGNLGLSAGVEFFTSLASVEMYLNRAYSMASDDYLDDAKHALDVSVDKLQLLLKNAV